MSIICFFGPDGSGKTTLAGILLKYLLSKNIRVKVSWLRGTHTLASILACILSKFNSFQGFDNPYYNIRIPDGMRRLWRFIEFISLLPILLARIFIPRLLGYEIICERSIPDFIVWIILTLRDPKFLSTLAGKFLISLSLKTKYLFYITASLNILKVRRSEMEIEFLRGESIIYDKLSKILDVYKIDTSDKSVEESINSILAHLSD